MRPVPATLLVAACLLPPQLRAQERLYLEYPWVATVECHARADSAAVRELEAFFRREVEAGRALAVEVENEDGLRRWTYHVREPSVATGAFADAVRLSGIEAASVAVHPAAD